MVAETWKMTEIYSVYQCFSANFNRNAPKQTTVSIEVCEQ